MRKHARGELQGDGDCCIVALVSLPWVVTFGAWAREGALHALAGIARSAGGIGLQCGLGIQALAVP